MNSNNKEKLKIKLLKNAIRLANENIFIDGIDDYYYKSYVLDFKYAKDDGANVEYYKNLIIQRLNTMINFLNASPEQWINESERMWEELYKTGKPKYYLDNKKYPLSQKDGITQCALCNYAVGVSRDSEICNSCPVKWTKGTCHELYNAWGYSYEKESRQEYAKMILDEIKNGRIDM